MTRLLRSNVRLGVETPTPTADNCRRRVRQSRLSAPLRLISGQVSVALMQEAHQRSVALIIMVVLLPPAGGSLSRVLARAALCPLHTELSPDSPDRAEAAQLNFGYATPVYLRQQCVCRPLWCSAGRLWASSGSPDPDPGRCTQIFKFSGTPGTCSCCSCPKVRSCS